MTSARLTKIACELGVWWRCVGVRNVKSSTRSQTRCAGPCRCFGPGSLSGAVVALAGGTPDSFDHRTDVAELWAERLADRCDTEELIDG